MSDKKTGGPAFPRIGEGKGNPAYDEAGMTLRDYFAAKAMQGMVASGVTRDLGGLTSDDPSWDGHGALQKCIMEHRAPMIATVSYAIADAMLAERNR